MHVITIVESRIVECRKTSKRRSDISNYPVDNGGQSAKWKKPLLPAKRHLQKVNLIKTSAAGNGQPLLTWSTDSSCIPGALTGYYQPGQLSPDFLIFYHCIPRSTENPFAVKLSNFYLQS
ncbi:hypothetical protein LAZ67_10000177 [Cordylochernes scorpioides]|uniref:Uncharacterized protein n=1 Tax=Cordylochernes scorpioides TaxID=51811 RepID=A0ABY6KUW5_9ARAC|nr:hypothetical protein LAZ67_10000177 [Cordylochernes scorpioides]